jgi:predicted polyphosphate/ATP-dependent NAD kinase
VKSVGIIANPASGKDIRRLVAFGSVFDNNEKVNIVRRLLLAMDSVGVEEVVAMPDDFHIGRRAAGDVEIGLTIRYLDMMITGTLDDSVQAARMMAELGVACIITLGGDGTNRAVAKACGDVPLLPISTGTNNVFPFMVEGTLAGIAAGVIARNSLSPGDIAGRAPRLEIYRGEELVDIALVDIVVSRPGFIGARAIWDVSTIYELFLTRAEPGQIGFSSVGGYLHPLPQGCGLGLHIVVGEGSQQVKAPIAPGLICSLPIASYHTFTSEGAIPISRTPSMIALDGEREINVRSGDTLTVRLNCRGPWVVDIDGVLQEACRRGLFLSQQPATQSAAGIACQQDR